MGDVSVTILLSFVSILLTINLYILKGIREDLKALWEKIGVLIDKQDHLIERLTKAEVEIANCSHQWDRRRPEE